MIFTDAARTIVLTPQLLDEHEARLEQARQKWKGIEAALDANPPALTPVDAANQCEELLNTIGRTSKGPDKAPRRARKARSGDGPQSPATLTDDEAAVLRAAIEAYGPLTIAMLEEVLSAGGRAPLAKPLGMPLEDALCSRDEFCSWHQSNSDGFDVWGTREQFAKACDERIGPLKDAVWIESSGAVTKLMNRMGCSGTPAKWVIDRAFAERAAK